ncbi:MAG: penicillin acylase family protein [Marmoricola sp.]
MSQPPTQPGTPQPGTSGTRTDDRFRDWPAPFRFVVYAVVILLVLGVIAAFAGTLVVRRPLPQTTGTLALDGLSAKVRVLRDRHGVPQIYADNPGDLFMAQGYVQAQDRFWQMDYRRHASSGRLSELFGRRTLGRDMVTRTLGWRRVAEQELPLLSADTRAALDSYSDGVNAWLSSHSGSRASLEYTVLSLSTDYRPEPWTSIDSLTWFKAMAWDLSGNIDDEIARARLSVDRDPAQISELYPPYPYGAHPPIVDTRPAARPAALPGERNTRIDRARLEPLARAAAAAHQIPALLGTGDGIGSNSWVVTGALTTSGRPLLANDPHFDVTAPSVFYQIGLHCRTVDDACPYDVSGFGYAGFPGVVIGHNAKIAWGMTNLHADTTDLYLEKVAGSSYLHDGRQEPLEQRDERIRVAGDSTRLVTVRSTRHGPLLSDVSREVSSTGADAPAPGGAPNRGNGYAVAVDWQGMAPSRSADAILGFDRATDWASFKAAAAELQAPAQNLVYADTVGNIGYQATGAIPVRKPGHTGDYPAAGWLKGQDPTGTTIPVGDLPTEFNPPSGVIVAANQAPVGVADSTRIADYWDYGYRSDRIGHLLRSRIDDGSKLRVADMTAIQNDTRNPVAPVLVPYLLDILLPSAYASGGQQLLADWDYSQPADSAAAAYFNAVWRNVLALTFHDQIPESLWPDGGSRWMFVMTQLLQQPDSPWWDVVGTHDVVENRDAILSKAMEDARDELVRRQSRDPAKWTWGHLHQLDLDRPMFTNTGLLARALFDRDGQGASGGSGAVDATSWDPRVDYAVTNAPAMRMVVDLGDLDRSRWVDLGGASGHSFGAHYLDQLNLWLGGRSSAWPFTPAQVKDQTQDTLTLTPPGRTAAARPPSPPP